ncbi:MAG: hypothetical protein ABL958_03035, partial [Bdellovibrionia bacterium]
MKRFGWVFLFAFCAFMAGCNQGLRQTVGEKSETDGEEMLHAAWTDKSTPWNECNSRSDVVFPDVIYFNGSLWCAVQNTNSQMRILEMDPSTFVYRSERTVALDPGSLVFNRFAVHNGQLWIGYRDGSLAKLLNVSTGNTEVLGQSGGNDPIALGYGWVAWQDFNFTIHRRALTGGAIVTLGAGRPTGLTQIKADGSITLIDDDRFSIAGGTRPCWAGDLVVIEGRDAGLTLRLTNGSEMTLWPGEITFTPKCAEVPGGWAVTTWGEHWARTAIVSPQDFSGGTSTLPQPNHALDFGYYYADGRYGNYNSEVFGFTNMTVLFSGAYDSSATWGNPDPAFNIERLFGNSLQSAYLSNKTIFLLAGPEADWDRVLDAATPYWSKVKYVELYHEDSSATASGAEAAVQRFAAKVASRGLSRPLFGALESPGAEQAPSIDFVGIEAYVPQPFNQDDAGNVQRLNAIIDARKATVGAGKKIMIVMMAYDRNGQWTNITTLTQLQYPAYLKAYSDPRVIAITMFSYARPGGARFYPSLMNAHKEMAGRIFNINPGPNPTPPPPAPSACPTVKPGPDWVCVNGGWLPPGHPGIPTLPPTPPPTVQPTPPPPVNPSTCPTAKPGPDWVCVSGGWLPPGHPGIPNQPVPTAQPTPPPPVNPSTCLTVKPGPDWICR